MAHGPATIDDCPLAGYAATTDGYGSEHLRTMTPRLVRGSPGGNEAGIATSASGAAPLRSVNP